MTTASVLITVRNSWNAANEKCEKEESFKKGSKDLLALAARELRETPSTKEQALKLMREWIAKNPDIRNIRTDESFLLRFLRQKKYSIPMAQQTLLKYLNLRKYYPEISKNLDCESLRIREIIESGYILVSPLRDTLGRRVIIYNIGKFDPNKYTCWDMAKTHLIVYESLLENNTDQICGFTHVGDGAGVNTSHIMAWNPIDFARLFKWGEQSLPVRHKEVHAINVPSAMKYVVDFVCRNITSKMSERINIHPTLKSLHSKMDPACLPISYGGKITIQEMIENTKRIVDEQRKIILELDHMEILSTRGIISSKNVKQPNNKDVTSIEGSFRKLEID